MGPEPMTRILRIEVSLGMWAREVVKLSAVWQGIAGL
jgi:hypothetical protein